MNQPHTVAPEPFRLALANLAFPDTPEDAVIGAERAIEAAADKGARIVCFPECYVPGYHLAGRTVVAPDAGFLERSWSAIAAAAKKHRIGVILGTERMTDAGLMISALVINPDGTLAGFQDKVQRDPSEEGTYAPATGRQVFRVGPLTFGVSICHEGWRYPETVRWAVRQGAQVVFHPHLELGEPGAYRPTGFADPQNTFHEKAALCRAAENTCYVATVNYAAAGSATTSAIIRPDGTLQCHQPYGEEGVLVAEIDLSAATGLLAMRYKPNQ